MKHHEIQVGRRRRLVERPAAAHLVLAREQNIEATCLQRLLVVAEHFKDAASLGRLVRNARQAALDSHIRIRILRPPARLPDCSLDQCRTVEVALGVFDDLRAFVARDDWMILRAGNVGGEGWDRRAASKQGQHKQGRYTFMHSYLLCGRAEDRDCI
jgi:hypothetical protein